MSIVENAYESSFIGSLLGIESDEHTILDKRPGIFATALAHEVRNPLTNINMAADILSQENLNEEQKSFVEIIRRGGERISKLISDFLNSHKAIEAHAEPCSVNELLEEVLEVNNDRLLLKTVFVEKDYGNDDCQIMVIRPQIKIALINVIVNAIEALPPENGILKLSTGTKHDKYTISIEDNGTGITEENLNKIFDPYYTNKPGGLGLGLSTTQDIITSNRGSLDVISTTGKGSCFTFSFQKIHHT